MTTAQAPAPTRTSVDTGRRLTFFRALRSE